MLEFGGRAASVAGRALADLGAEVIKLEPPGGEAGRHEPPRMEHPAIGGISYFWLAFNASKRSMTLDFECRAGREVLVKLFESADIVLSDFERFDTAQADDLCALARAANADLVWTEIWPFGRGHEFEAVPGTDFTVQALGGHLFLNGDLDRPPVRVGLPVAIMQGGAEAAAASMMAYYHRLRGGSGQRVDVSMQECIIWTLLNTTMAWQLLGREEVRGGAVRQERTNKYFTRLVWPCRDGFIHFAPVGGGGGTAREKSYDNLVAWMTEEGHFDETLTERDWNGADASEVSQESYDAVSKVIGDFLKTKTIAEIMDRAVEDRILIASINSVDQVFANAHLRARDYFRIVRDSARGLELEYPAPYARLSGTPLRAPEPAPIAGSDTKEILEDLGFDSRLTQRLIEIEVV